MKAKLKRIFALLLVFAASVVFFVAEVVHAGVATGQQSIWINFAGKPAGNGNVDGTGSAARFGSPNGIAVDSSNNAYVADTDNHAIRKISPAGVVTTLAGSPGSSGVMDGTGSTARFSSPQCVAVDGSGNVYVADTGNHAIRKISPAGVVTTLAGSPGSSGITDGTGSTARFSSPQGVAVDGGGNVYVADTGNFTIRKISPAGVVTTPAGSPGSPGNTNGTGSAALFRRPVGIAVDGSFNVYVADSRDHTLRKITSAGVVTTLAGSAGSSGSTDSKDGTSKFNSPGGVAVDSSGNVYVADTNNHTIRRVTSAGVVTTLAGSPGGSGMMDQTGGAARFSSPQGVAVDGGGTVYVADTKNNALRKINSDGVVTTLAGSAANIGSTDGVGDVARFDSPLGVARDGGGNVYVADSDNHTIRRITSAGEVTTLAGSAGSSGSTDSTDAAPKFNSPGGVAVDSSGNVYVADTDNHAIRKITPAGVTSTFAGLAGDYGSTDGGSDVSQFNSPYGIAVDGAGAVYVADTYNHSIRKITPDGVVTTVAGATGDNAGDEGYTDGNGAATRFSYPQGVAVDSSGNIYVADSGNHTIRKIDADGEVTTFAGDAKSPGSADGGGSAARFKSPRGVTVDASGNVYVADTLNHTIRKITSEGMVSTIGGTAGLIGGADGAGTAAQFSQPSSLAVASDGTLFVVDTLNHRITRLTRVDYFQPILELAAVSALGGSGVTLNGKVNPNGQVTTAQMEYGITNAYGSTASVSLSPDNGDGLQNVSAALSGLTNETTYHYRLTATNKDGTSVSADGTFTTLSRNANLSSLALGSGTLSPTFTPATSNYTASVTYATSSLTVTPTCSDSTASVKVNGTLVASGTASLPISLVVGNNTITVQVTAQDGTINSYTVSVTRAAQTYDEWATAARLTEQNALLDASPFKDGIKNLMKYAFNMSGSMADCGVLASSGTSGLPRVTLEQNGAQRVLRIEFLRRKNSDWIYSAQRSTALNNFVEMTGIPSITPIDDQWERVNVTEVVTTPSAFARIKVTKP